jgi:hypothetical protein
VYQRRNIFRALLPDERAWTFKEWLVQKVIPNMLAFHFLNEMGIIITDGDKPETSPLDIAIELHFPPVMRLRCGWHIMNQGGLANGPKSTAVLELRSSPPKTQSGSKRKNKLDTPPLPPHPINVTFVDIHEWTGAMHTAFHLDIRALEINHGLNGILKFSQGEVILSPFNFSTKQRTLGVWIS